MRARDIRKERRGREREKGSEQETKGKRSNEEKERMIDIRKETMKTEKGSE